LNLDLQITPFFKNKHFELCCFVMYRVCNIVNRRESDVICHSVRRLRVPTSYCIIWHSLKLELHMFQGLFCLLSSFYGIFGLFFIEFYCADHILNIAGDALAYVKLEILCHIRGFFFSISNFYAMTSRSLSYHIQCLGQVIHVCGSHEWYQWYVTVVQKFNVHVFLNLQWFNWWGMCALNHCETIKVFNFSDWTFFFHWFQKIICTFVVVGFTLPLVLLLMYLPAFGYVKWIYTIFQFGVIQN
jgi:hypothetical protein